MTTLKELIEQWDARSKDALPSDAMLMNKHIRELRTALAQQGEPEIAMIDAAMVEMANISPPLRRSECQRLIRAALSAAPAPQAQEQACPGCHCHFVGSDVTAPGSTRLVNTAPQPAQELTGCACRWDADDKRIATCVRHQGWLDVVSEWAERAKAAEAALQSAQALARQRGPVDQLNVTTLDAAIDAARAQGGEK